MTPVKRVVGAALILVLLLCVGAPHALFSYPGSYLGSAACCLLLALGFVVLLRGGGVRAQLGVGAILFASMLMTSACIGVFFHLPLGKALLAFLGISIAGSLILTAMAIYLSVRVFPDLQADQERDTGTD